ncbi:MAG: hypothetical protein V4695_08465 [Pseudomonadota bacterium]
MKLLARVNRPIAPILADPQMPARQTPSKLDRKVRFDPAPKTIASMATISSQGTAASLPSSGNPRRAAPLPGQHCKPPPSRLWSTLKNMAERFLQSARKPAAEGIAIRRSHSPAQVEFTENGIDRTYDLDAIRIEMDRSQERTYLCGRTQTDPVQTSFLKHELSLFQGALSGQGVLEFVSRKAHFRPDESMSRPLIKALREQWHERKGDPDGLVLGGRFKVVGVYPENPPALLPDGVEPLAEHMHFTFSFTVLDLKNPYDAPRVIPVTQLGLEFKGKYLNATQIEQAHNILLMHKRSCADVQALASAAPQSLPLIASSKGRGRAPTLITYSEIVNRIDSGLVVDEASLDAALIDVIERGRSARICNDLQNDLQADIGGFVHSDQQLKELKAALSTHMQNRIAIAAVQRGVASESAHARSPAAQAFNENRFSQLQNRGNGDCLFHSLEGTANRPSLSESEILAIRKRVSTVKENQEDTEVCKKANAHALSAAMRQVGTSLKSNNGMVSNAAYAAFQARPGNMAGTDEVRQWLQLPENRSKTVVILDAVLGDERIDVLIPSVNSRNGEVEIGTVTRSFAGTAANGLSAEEIERAVAEAITGTEYGNPPYRQNGAGVIPADRIVLYRTPGHFSRITGLKDHETRTQDANRKQAELDEQRRAAADPNLDISKLGFETH